MVRRSMKNKKRLVQTGGATRYGEDVNSISTFLPSSIPDLVLWIKISKNSAVYSKISDYISEQSIIIKEKLAEVFKDNLDASVITEIKGGVNSLVRFELDSSESSSFPTYISNENELDKISLKFTDHSFKLVAKNRVELQDKFSVFSISDNVIFNYIPTFNQFVIGTNYEEYLNTGISNFSEIILYSRELNEKEKETVEGYLAYTNNNQYNLPLNHAYLPDMAYLPELSSDIIILKGVDDKIKKAFDNLNKAVEEYSDKSEQDLPLKGRLTEGLETTNMIHKILSKGALLAKKLGPVTMDSIYDSANKLNTLTVPFTSEFIKYKIIEITTAISDVYAYIEKLKTTLPDKATVASMKTIEEHINEQEREISNAQTSEIFQGTQIEIEAREFYETIHKRSSAINKSGTNEYENIHTEFKEKVSVFLDAIEYNNKKIEDDWLKLITSFKPIEQQILSKEWLNYIKSIDITESNVVKRGNDTYSIEYRDSYLNMIQSTYEKIRNQVYNGDIGYLRVIITQKATGIKGMYDDIENKKIQLTMINTFLPHFKQEYNEINIYVEKYATILQTLIRSISSITEALDHSKRYGTIYILEDLPTISTLEIFRDECKTVYIKKVNVSDSKITGIEYIITDIEGNIKNTVNKDGSIEVSYFFAKYMNIKYNSEDLMYILYHSYKDKDGNSLRQEYKILGAFDKSIIESLPKPRQPNYWWHKINHLFEIPRDQINGIHQIIFESAQYPIQLPKFGIPVGFYFLIQNVGLIPIQVQNPGGPTDFIDTIGYNESMIYIYTGLNEAKGNTHYARMYWRDDYLPHDNLLNFPRSKYCVFVKELNTSIFVKENSDKSDKKFEPILDYDGYFVKANIDSKGYTYDIDDIYKTNPYRVELLKQISASDLKETVSKVSIRPDNPQIFVTKDIITGLPILCNFKGVPSMNEFGFCKISKSPIMLINDIAVVRGVFGDINVKFTDVLEVEQLGMIEPFLKFDTLFRSKFVQSYAKEAIKTFVFISSSKYPILSPKNNFIEAEEWALSPPQEIQYTNLKGHSEIAYILKDSDVIKDSPMNALPYQYISVKGSMPYIDIKRSAKIIINRYNTDKNYITICLDIIKKTYTDAEILGKNAVEATLSALTSADEKITAKLNDYNSYASTIESIQASLDAGVLTNSLKVTIEMLDLKMNDAMQYVAETFYGMKDTIKLINEILEKIKVIEASVTEIRTKNVTEIEEKISLVKDVFQTDANNLKNTGSPDIDRLLKLMIKNKIEFVEKLNNLEISVKTRPDYSSEYPKWIDAQQNQIKELNVILVKIRSIEETDVPHVFKVRENTKRSETIQKINDFVGQFDIYKKYKNAIGLWLGINENAEYNSKAPVINTNDSLVKGISISFNVFKELNNPSVQRDWKKFVMSAEITTRMSSEIFSLLNPLIDKYRLFFLQDLELSPGIDSIKEMDLTKLNETLNLIETKMKENTSQILSFESDISPILKAYDSIRSDLRAEYRKNLTANNQMIQTKWIDITSKRTAIQTILTHKPDTAKEYQLEKLFEIEPKVNKILINDPSFYDTISYFKMREIKDSQDAFLMELEDTNEKINKISKEIV
jgi:hypothetical protein